MNHEHEQHRARSTAMEVGYANDMIEPGQLSRSALLRKPEHAIGSGLVQRKARDADGVAADADRAVIAASSSTGAPLPEAVMRRFESALGVDLSGVRVHTGEVSERAAEALGAKAYTIGNDIHFATGHYDPSSSAGQHLLAHEIAHTVQQTGAAHRAQFKLAVSSPGDNLEQEADRAADAMLAGSTATVSGMRGQILQRDKRPWPFNGYVRNDSDQPVSVWSDDKGVYKIPAKGTSDRFRDDVDHIQDCSGQWWKIGAGNVTVDSKGNVHGAKCKTSTYGKDCGG